MPESLEHKCKYPDLLLRLSDIVKREQAMEEKIDKLLTIMNGNGKAGMCAKVEALWNAHKDKQKSNAGWVDWSFRLIIVILLGWMNIK